MQTRTAPPSPEQLFRSAAREQGDGIRAVRGLMIAGVASAVMWVGTATAVIALLAR